MKSSIKQNHDIDKVITLTENLTVSKNDVVVI